MVASRKSRRQESKQQRKSAIENAAREFVKDLFSLIEVRKGELFHLLRSDQHPKNVGRLTTLIAKYAMARASKSLSLVRLGPGFLAAARPHIRVYAALRLDHPYPSMLAKSIRRMKFDNSMIDFLEGVSTVTGGANLYALTDFARRMCDDVDDL